MSSATLKVHCSSSGTPFGSPLDHYSKYLVDVLGFVGIKDVVLAASVTLARPVHVSLCRFSIVFLHIIIFSRLIASSISVNLRCLLFGSVALSHVCHWS